MGSLWESCDEKVINIGNRCLGVLLAEHAGSKARSRSVSNTNMPVKTSPDSQTTQVL